MSSILWQVKALKQMRKIPANIGKDIRTAVTEELTDLSIARNASSPSRR
jgi:hypothetical protein